MKDMFRWVLTLANQKFGFDLDQEQEIMISLCNMMIFIYSVESALLRAEKLAHQKGVEKVEHQIHLTMIYLHNSLGEFTI